MKSKRKGIIFHGFFSPNIRKKAISLAKRDDGKLLEVGCGEGLLLLPLAEQTQMEVYGLDRLDYLFWEAKRRVKKEGFKNIFLVKGQGEQLPFKGKAFDVVMCINTLADLRTKKRAEVVLKEMGRISREGGTLVLDFRNQKSPFYRLQKYLKGGKGFNPLFFTLKEIQSLVEESGFKIKKIIPLLFPLTYFAPVIIIKAIKENL